MARLTHSLAAATLAIAMMTGTSVAASAAPIPEDPSVTERPTTSAVAPGAPRAFDGTIATPLAGAEPVLPAATARLRVTFASELSSEAVPSPANGLDVTFWRFDAETELYYETAGVGAWERGASANEWISPLLPEGTYAIRFVPSSQSLGMVYWPTARWWAESGTFDLWPDTTSSIGTVVFPRWTISTYRLAGKDRFETGAVISDVTREVRGGVETVYLANGLNYPDALAAGPAAAVRDGALLLTAPTALPAATRAALVRINPRNIVVVGGAGAVSGSVVGAVRSAVPGATVTRQQGADRYATGEALVRSAFGRTGAPTAFIATGRTYADALAAGAAAGHVGAPVILLDGTARTLPATTARLLSDLDTEFVAIVGGTGAVSAGIERDLKALLGSRGTVRLAGADRYMTAMSVNTAVFDFVDEIVLANGLNYPDALAGAPLAASVGAPIYLTPPTCITDAVRQGVDKQHPNIIGFLGGPGALSQNAYQLRTC